MSDANHSDAPATVPPPYGTLPSHVQYVEPLPPWLESELALGRASLPELRAALVRAQRRCTGSLPKTKMNKDQGYKYAGHDDVLEHVRAAMAEEGLTVEQVTIDLEEVLTYANKWDKESTLWKWRVVSAVWHVSGAGVARILRPITVPGNKASSIASTTADSMLLMRLMRLSAEEPEEGGGRRDERRSAPGRADAGPPERARELNENELGALDRWTKERLALLSRCDTEARLILWGRIVRARRAPKGYFKALWGAWEQQCSAVGLLPSGVGAALRRTKPIAESEVEETKDGRFLERASGEVLA